MKGVGAAATGAAGLTLLLPRKSRASWGEVSGVWGASPPDCKVLELFLYGGLAPWESFYSQPNVDDGFQGSGTALDQLNWAGCSGAPATPRETRSIGSDAAGQPVALGPLTKPLWRADILDRLRVVALSHALFPHEAAIPLALTGRGLGDVNLASLGTAVSHRWTLVNPGIGPRSYILTAPGLDMTDNLEAATAVGQHPAFAQPLRVEVGDASLQARLQRSGRREGTDELWSNLREAFVDQTRSGPMGTPHRSRAVTNYETAANAVLDSGSLIGLLGAAPLTAISEDSCVTRGASDPYSGLNETSAALQTAATLLTTPDGPRHVTVIDSGLTSLPDSTGYDTHTANHVPTTAVNLWSALASLADVIREPGGPSAGKIDLDDTIILLNTEFGRTPALTMTPGLPPAQQNPGREHWPYGYVNVLIGGPVGGAGPSVAGALDSSGGAVTTTSGQPLTYGPADIHAAVMLAAGVWPFETENFNQSAVTPFGTTDLEIALALKAEVLGA